MPIVEEVATMTAKGQITVPKIIRDALGADAGTKMTFALREDGRVLVSRATNEHDDPPLGAFLALLDKDIDAARNVHDLPEDLAQALTEAAERTAHLDEPIVGDVEL